MLKKILFIMDFRKKNMEAISEIDICNKNTNKKT